jgi:hypothetical protein
VRQAPVWRGVRLQLQAYGLSVAPAHLEWLGHVDGPAGRLTAQATRFSASSLTSAEVAQSVKDRTSEASARCSIAAIVSLRSPMLA